MSKIHYFTFFRFGVRFKRLEARTPNLNAAFAVTIFPGLQTSSTARLVVPPDNVAPRSSQFPVSTQNVSDSAADATTNQPDQAKIRSTTGFYPSPDDSGDQIDDPVHHNDPFASVQALRSPSPTSCTLIQLDRRVHYRLPPTAPSTPAPFQPSLRHFPWDIQHSKVDGRNTWDPLGLTVCSCLVSGNLTRTGRVASKWRSVLRKPSTHFHRQFECCTNLDATLRSFRLSSDMFTKHPNLQQISRRTRLSVFPFMISTPYLYSLPGSLRDDDLSGGGQKVPEIGGPRRPVPDHRSGVVWHVGIPLATSGDICPILGGRMPPDAGGPGQTGISLGDPIDVDRSETPCTLHNVWLNHGNHDVAGKVSSSISSIQQLFIISTIVPKAGLRRQDELEIFFLGPRRVQGQVRYRTKFWDVGSQTQVETGQKFHQVPPRNVRCEEILCF
ncbi:hypothetical protein C8F04DRAFT_1194585 [Mycena alexandri]|uniref:Uncharacterized protein n=1 Tax=Mycena alexandri TaxID=1745969 RepID=A0AAD6S9V3_9AGAR|nr:hypothetical protein C8F04DRAFT_1194585 [Mycena alexandri]